MNNETLSQAASSSSAVQLSGDKSLTCDGVRLTFEVTPHNLLLVAQQGARAELLLAPESDYTRVADSLGVSEEAKIGSQSFDHKYVIRDNHGKAKEILTSEVVELVEELEPFIELELCNDIIRLLKKPADEGAALADAEILARLSKTVGND